MPITIPPWLKPADVAGDYQRGLQIGVSVANERSRLAQEQEDTAMRLQVSQQENQREHALQQQRMATDAAYHQQQIELRKQQLDQVKAMNDQKTANAARLFTARQQFSVMNQKIDSDPNMTEDQRNDARRRAIFDYGTTAGLPGTEMSAMVKASQKDKPTVPASFDTTTLPGQTIITQSNGTKVIHNNPRATSEGDVLMQLPDPSSPDSLATVYHTVPRGQAPSIQAGLPPNLQTNAINRAALSGGSTTGTAKHLDADTARSLLKEAGGDKAKARAKAKELGYTF